MHESELCAGNKDNILFVDYFCRLKWKCTIFIFVVHFSCLGHIACFSI